MRAASISEYTSIDNVAVKDVEKPEPKKGRLLVKVMAGALNPADLKIVTGQDGGRWLRARRFPLVVGYDFCGTIVAAPADPHGHAVGETVFGFVPYGPSNRFGTLAEYVEVAGDGVARVPPGVTAAEAACAATAAVSALQGLRDLGRLRAGQRVLIHGASGGVGSYAVRIAKLMGAEVWATSSSVKFDYVRKLGADHVLDYRAAPLTTLTNEFHVILDAAARSRFGECRSLLSQNGTYVSLLPSLRFLVGKLSSLFSRRSARVVMVRPVRADLEQIANWLATGEFAGIVDSSFSLDQVPAALQRLAAGDACGKIAIAVS